MMVLRSDSSRVPEEVRAARLAHADDAGVAEAQERFKEGLELADQNKHEPARLKFQQAYAVFKAPAVLYNLARSEQLTGHDIEALEHFRTFVKVSQTDAKVTDAMREKARQNVEDLAKRVISPAASCWPARSRPNGRRWNGRSTRRA